MKKVLLSLLSVGVVAGVAVLATGAFFSDTETSTGNTFTAGELDLQVDNECHYNGAPCIDPDGGGPMVLSWSLADLVNGVHKFFSFNDIKPGDSGEDTVSLHVFDNDAWGRFVISNVQDLENGCTDPEDDVPDPTCGLGNDDGELRENLNFWVWLDEGSVNGFQCPDNGPAPCDIDSTEGDNIWQEGTELMLITPGTIDIIGETHNIWEGIAAAYATNQCSGTGNEQSDCPGLTRDGHMVGSITYYFGIGWEVPSTVGNIIQSDSLGADMTFEVEQYRNNPTPFAP